MSDPGYMTYDEAKALAKASSSFEGIKPTAIADALCGAHSPSRYVNGRKLDLDDVRTAAVAAYELGRLGLGREAFWGMVR